MDIINDFNQSTPGNTIFVNKEKSFLENGSSITFVGSGNILFIEDGVRISNSQIKFKGDNALVYLSSNSSIYYLNIDANYGSCIFVGKNNYINGKITLITSERKNIIIGSYGLISYGISVRTADPHLIYSCETKKRINPSKSVLIGDHVWLGQSAMILKGTIIGSGSIIGGGSVVTNKKIPSNSSCAGNPARIISTDIFFSKECVHNFSQEMTNQYQVMDSDEWIYSKDASQMPFEQLDEMICFAANARDKLKIIKKYIAQNHSKNRFYIPHVYKKKSGFFRRKNKEK